MALRAQKVSGAFEKRAPGIICRPIWESFAVRGSFAGLYNTKASVFVYVLYVLKHGAIRLGGKQGAGITG